MLTKEENKIALPEFNNMSYDIDKLHLSALPNKFQPIPIHIDN